MNTNLFAILNNLQSHALEGVVSNNIQLLHESNRANVRGRAVIVLGS